MFQYDLGLTQWLIYAMYGLAVVVCLAAIIRAIFIPSDVRRVCCCGGCGYPITGDPPARCPECGGQLTKVGISTPAMAVRLRGGLAAALLAWTVICGLLAQVGWGFVQQAAWTAWNTAAMIAPAAQKTQHTRQTNYSPQNFGRNQSVPDLSFRIDLDASYVEDRSVVESGTVTLALRENGSDAPATVELDLGARTFTLKDASDVLVKQGAAAEFDETVTKKWFETAGIVITSPPGKTARDDARKLIASYFKDPQGVDSLFQMGGLGDPGSLYSGGGSSGSSPVGMGGAFGAGPGMPDYWTLRTQIIATVLAAVYIVGFVGIWLRRRRLLA
jgi:hypothetical protein